MKSDYQATTIQGYGDVVLLNLVWLGYLNALDRVLVQECIEASDQMTNIENVYGLPAPGSGCTFCAVAGLHSDR